MNQESIKFKIDQLRKDKIIYATEGVVVCTLAVVGLLFSSYYFSGTIRLVTDIWCLGCAIGYSLFMAIGNFLRFKEIKRLEQKLA